jgi:predicted XRE-type DNA-binding protein
MSKLGKRLIVSAKEARAMVEKKRYASIWDAIEPSRAQAANMKARAEMMTAIRETVAAWGLTQAATAKRLGLTQPRMNDLLRGRINKFSLDALINLATAAGLAVRVEVVRPAA